jgi:lipopolysaccharide/colanic/teichoic acid biosynthesis glycosyltransferase
LAKRIFDIIASLTGLLILSPVLIIIALLVIIDSRGGVFYLQTRVGKNNIDFKLFKFRTMAIGADKKGLLTVGVNDNRVTKVGYYLRKYKLDELPQLLNVFFGSMSLVGPRPEVRRYVSLYNAEQLKILTVQPGITDYASIAYSNENEILGKVSNPEEVYINQIMPAKLLLNLQYVKEKGILTDLKLIFKTLVKIIR